MVSRFQSHHNRAPGVVRARLPFDVPRANEHLTPQLKCPECVRPAAKQFETQVRYPLTGHSSSLPHGRMPIHVVRFNDCSKQVLRTNGGV